MGGAVDEYLARLPEEQREVPAFRYNGKPLVSIGAAKRHVALYIMYSAVLKTYKDELRAFDTSNTVVRFTPDKPLPARLVLKLVKARVAELEGSSPKGRSLRPSTGS